MRRRTLLSLVLALALLAPMANAKRLHTIGDSTMDGSYDPATTYKRGWVMMLQQFLDADQLTINNRGKSGASSKSFYREAPYWPTLKTGGSNQMTSGDLLLIQFAHNDEKNGGMDGDSVIAYYNSIGNTTAAAGVDYRGTTANGTYKEYIRKYIDEAKAMGVKPIVVGAICRKYFNGNTIRPSGRHNLYEKFDRLTANGIQTAQKLTTDDGSQNYTLQASLVAAEYNDVPFIDLTELTAQLYASYGDAYCTSDLFGPDDSTHPAALGATLISRTFAQGVKDLYESAEYALPANAARKAVLKELYDALILSNEISFSPTSGDMGEAYVGKSAKKEFNISAFGLTPAAGTMTISVSEGFEVSIDGQNWSSSTTASYTGATLITSVTVRAQITAAGALNGTLTVSDGTNTQTLALSVLGKSLLQGEEVNLTFTDTTYSAMTAAATAQPDVPATHAKMQLFTTTDGSWPGGEIDEQSGRYIQFRVAVPEGKTFYADEVSYDVMGWGGNAACYHSYVATKADFSDQVFVDEKQTMTNKTAYSVSKELNLQVEEDGYVYVRFYPWIKTSSVATGKYLAISDLKVHGTMVNAGGVSVEGTITIAKRDDDPVYNPESMDVMVESITSTLGATFTSSTNITYSGLTGNGTILTLYKNDSGAKSASTPSAANTLTYTITPAEGFSFAPSHIAIDGCRNGTNGGTLTVIASVATASETLATGAALSRSGNGIDLTTIGGDVQNLVATAENPLKIAFSILSLDNSKSVGLGNLVITGTMTGAAAQTTKHTLSVSVSPAGAGTVEQDPVGEQIKEGREVSLTAKPNFGYRFVKWTVDGADQATTAATTVTMDANKAVVAVFEAVPVYTIQTRVTNDQDFSLGSVTLSPNDHNGQYEQGTVISAKAETNKILTFRHWEDQTTANPRAITVTEDKTITATYEIQDFIAVFDASAAQAYDYTGNGFVADITWDANRNTEAKVVRVSDGVAVYTNDGKTVGNGGTPVVRNREGVVVPGLNGLYQNGYYTDQIAWQYRFSTVGFTTARFEGQMAAKNAALKNYKAQYSLDGTSFSDIAGATFAIPVNTITDIAFDLPAACAGQPAVYVRITGTGTEKYNTSYNTFGQFCGLDYCEHSESGVGHVYILGTAVVEQDEQAPVVTSTIPAANATGVSAKGTITISYDERIQAGTATGAAMLNGQALTAAFSSRSVSFQYIGLTYGQTYTFTMPAGYVQDRSGNAAAAVSLTFTVMNREVPQARLFDAIVDKSLDLNHGQSSTSAEGIAQYRYIQDAINAAPATPARPYLIYIKEGYYNDPNPSFNDSYGQRYDLNSPNGTYGGMTNYDVINNSVNGNGVDKTDATVMYDSCRLVYINKPNIHLIGQATDKVVIATDRLAGGDLSRPSKVWYHVNAAAAVEIQAGADDALLSTLTIDNENWTIDRKEGPQALCLNTNADRLIFNELNVQSYQDDYKASGVYNRAYWYQSRFEGSVDYIYGDCDIFFEQCIQDINRKAGGYIVAPSHPLETRWGYVFNNNIIRSTMFGDECQVYLGRPWHGYPKTVFLHTQMEVKSYAQYWAETMGGLPAVWAVYDMTDKNGVAMSDVSRGSYYAIAADGTFAEGTYQTKESAGNGQYKFTRTDTKNSLTASEASLYTMENVLAGDGSVEATGYWNPALNLEKTEVPVLEATGLSVSWEADPYAICYVVYVNNKPVSFVTEATYEGEDGNVVAVQSVNADGVLSALSETVTLSNSPSGIADNEKTAPVLKALVRGRLMIIRNGHVYDVTGR